MQKYKKKKLLKWKRDYSDMPYDYMYNFYMKARYKRQAPLQKTFNIAAGQMLEQGVRSARKGYGNLYDGPDGMMCPIRALIPDRDWVRSTMEFKSCDCGPVAAALLKNGHDLDLCKAIQKIHDGVDPVNWRRELKRVAREFEIDFKLN